MAAKQSKCIRRSNQTKSTKQMTMLLLLVSFPLVTNCFVTTPSSLNYVSFASLQRDAASSRLRMKNNNIENDSIGAGSVDDDESTRREFLSSVIGAITVATAVTLDDPEHAEASAAPASIPMKESTNTKSKALEKNGLPTELISSTATTAPSSKIDYQAIFQKSAKKALGGGKAGASAAVVQVCSLMWLRTAMNYQYRYGGNLSTSLKSLMEEGGIPRLYQGLPFALLQGPLTRFGDTAANIGILALLNSMESTADLPLPLKTFVGSVSAGLWRIFLMPIDSSKTVMQVEGSDGLKRLWGSVQEDKSLSPLFQGAFASAAATAVGHFPWFLTYNYLDDVLPVVSQQDDLLLSLCRSAVMGLSAACVSDCCSNSLRVIKTTKQTAQLGSVVESSVDVTSEEKTKGNELSYGEALALIIEKDGWTGLLGRGLKTRLLTNAIQGAVFSVLWKYFQNLGSMQ